MPDAIAALEAAEAFIASPLIRTRQTMELARAALGLPPARYALEPALKELTFGEWEGLTWPQVAKRDPAGARAREADKWNFAPPDGESYAMLAARLQPWLDVAPGRLLRRLARRRRPRADDADRRRQPAQPPKTPTSGKAAPSCSRAAGCGGSGRARPSAAQTTYSSISGRRPHRPVAVKPLGGCSAALRPFR